MSVNENENNFLALVKNFEAANEASRPTKLNESDYIKLSEYYRDNNHYDQAHYVLDEAITYYPYSAQAHFRKAQLFFSKRELEKALEALELSSVYAPNDLEMILLKADILNEKGKNNEALALLDTAPTANDSDLSDILLYKAMIYEKLNHLDEMFESTKLALEADPNNEEALEHVWWCVELTGRYQESVDLHLQLLERRTYSYLSWYNLGYAYYNCLLYTSPSPRDRG